MEKVVIEVWLPEYPVIPRLLAETKKQAETFNALHPDYEVVIRGLDFLKLPTELFHAAQEGRQPAVAQLFYTSTQLARDLRTRDGEPLFTPIETAIAGRREILGHPVVLGDTVRTAREFYTFDGVAAAVPPLTSTTILYANTTVLERAGVTALPQTWAEVETACRAVAAVPGGPSHGITWPNHGWFFQQGVACQGGFLSGAENGRSGRPSTVDLVSSELLAYVEWWRQLQRDGHFLYPGVPASGPRTAEAWENNYQAFADQRVAFVLSTSVQADQMVQAGRDNGFAVQAGRTPYNGETGYAGNVIGGDALWLTRGLDERTQDGALAFLQYIGTAENAAARHKFTGFMPVTESAIALLESEGWFAENPHHQVAVDQLAAGDGSPGALGALLGDFAGIQEVLTWAMHDVLTTGAEPAERFRQANAEAQRLLDHYTAQVTGAEPGPWGSNCFRVG
ncbi:extracellular solute-binding protein [Amycolatopsis sp. NPDC004747]